MIFADPPYKMGLCDKLIALLSLQKFNWNGILVLEHESGWEYAGESFVLIKRIESGDFIRKYSVFGGNGQAA